MRNWRASLPPDAPNAFLINVLPDQVEGVGARLPSLTSTPHCGPWCAGVWSQSTTYSTRGGSATSRRSAGWVSANQFVGPTCCRAATVVAGQRGETRRNRVRSVLRYGTPKRPASSSATLTMTSWARVSAKVTSLRGGLGQFSRQLRAVAPGVLEPLPTTYIAATRAPDNPAWLNGLLAQYPNVLAIDVGELLHQVGAIVEQVARAVEFVFLFTLAGGVLVLEAAIAATQDERLYDAAVLRTLGASRRQLTAAQLAEFLAQLVTSRRLVAAGGATATAYVLADRVFHIRSAGTRGWAIGIVGGAGRGAAGWIGTRRTLRQPPLALLRQFGWAPRGTNRRAQLSK